MDSSPYLGHDLLTQYAQPNGLFPNGLNAGVAQPQGPMGGQIPPQIQQLLRQLIQQRLMGGAGGGMAPGGMGGQGGQVPGMSQPQGGMGGGLPPQLAQMIMQKILQGGGGQQQAPQGMGLLQALMGGGQPGMGGMSPRPPQTPGAGQGINPTSLLQLVQQMTQQGGGAQGQPSMRGPLGQPAQGQPMAPRPQPQQPRPQMSALNGMGQVGAASSPASFATSPLNPAPTVGVGEFSSPDVYRRSQ